MAAKGEPQKLEITCNLPDLIKLSMYRIIANTMSGGLIFACKSPQGGIFIMKITAHRKTEIEIYSRKSTQAAGTMNTAEAETRVMLLLKKHFIDTGITPHLAEILDHRMCVLTELVKSIGTPCSAAYKQMPAFPPPGMVRSPQEIICEYAERIDLGFYEDRASIVFLEHCGYMSLHNVFEHGIATGYANALDTLRGILFSIVFTLTAITDKFPLFRHGDLHAGNIMILNDMRFVVDPHHTQFVRYRRGGDEWLVPFRGAWIKIIDFGYSQIPEEDVISDQRRDPLDVLKMHLSDIHYLLYYIRQNCMTLLRSNPLAEVLDRELFQPMDPQQIRDNHAGIAETLKRAKDPLTYPQILACSAFDAFKITAEKKLPDAPIYQTFEAPPAARD